MLVTIGSATVATRVARTITKKLGIPVKVVSTPTALNRGGCSYSVKFNGIYASGVRRVVKEYNLPIRKWYEENGADFERVYDDLS